MTLKSLPDGYRGFDHLAGFLEAPAVSAGPVGHDLELAGVAGLEQRARAAELGRGTQLTADEDHVELAESFCFSSQFTAFSPSVAMSETRAAL